MELPLALLEEQLYLGHLNNPCPYLKDRPSRLLFLNGLATGNMYRLLMEEGYRRHGVHLYRPDCPACQECRVLRVPVDRFRMSRSQKRVWRRGESRFALRVESPSYSQEKENLYNRYLEFQHEQGETDLSGQELPGEESVSGEEEISSRSEEERQRLYTDFFVDSFLGKGTREMQLYEGDRLVGVGLLDLLGDALSSVYFYFDPSVATASPGVYSVLKEIQLAREWGLKYYYPGYYIKNSPAMNYKRRYRPCQIKTPLMPGWRELPGPQ